MSKHNPPREIRTAPTTKEIRGEATKGIKPSQKPTSPKKPSNPKP